MKATRTIRINAPTRHVFAYLTDIGRHHEWAGNPLDIQPTSTGPLQLGSTWRSVGRRLGTHVDSVVVTDLDPDRTFAFEATGDAGRWRTTFTLAADGTVTVLRRQMRSLRLTWFTRLLAPMILLGNGHELATNLQKIKSTIEAAVTVGGEQ